MKFQIITILALISTISIAKPADAQLKTGTWRGALKTQTGNELPFNFILKDTAGKQTDCHNKR